MVNIGPNPVTHIFPTELFPTNMRASGHGFAAASGKVRAAVGIFILPVFNYRIGLGPTIFILAAGCFPGSIMTVIFGVETKGRSLETIF